MLYSISDVDDSINECHFLHVLFSFMGFEEKSNSSFSNENIPKQPKISEYIYLFAFLLNFIAQKMGIK